jgi:hypothetical protein
MMNGPEHIKNIIPRVIEEIYERCFMKLTNEQINRIEKAAKEATHQGPWDAPSPISGVIRDLKGWGHVCTAKALGDVIYLTAVSPVRVLALIERIKELKTEQKS